MSVPNKDKNMSRKILDVDSRIIWAILLVTLMIALVFPLGMPVTITKQTREFHKYIDDLPPGSVVIMSNDVEAGHPALFATLGAVISDLLRHPIKFVIVHMHQEGPYVTIKLLKDYVPKEVVARKTYGVDYVVFGFAPGQEVALSGMLSDIRTVYKTDVHGTPVDDLPLMKTVHNSKDFQLAIGVGDRFDYVEIDVRQFVASAKLPLLEIPNVGGVPGTVPFYPSSIKAILAGEPAGVEYEALLGEKGVAVIQNDLLGLCYGFVLIAIIFGNIVYGLNRFSTKKGVR